jgi:hypothetical protein
VGCQEARAYISKHTKLWTYKMTKSHPVKWVHKDTSCQLVQPCTNNVTTSQKKKKKKMYGHQYLIFQQYHQAYLSILHSVGWDFPSPGSICHTLRATARPRFWVFCHMEITDFRDVFSVCQICESSSRQSQDCGGVCSMCPSITVKQQHTLIGTGGRHLWMR